MNPGLLLYAVAMSVVYLCLAVWLVHAIRNPRDAWDRMYGRHTKGGEPLPDALEKLQRQSVVGLIAAPILFVAGGFMAHLKLQQLERQRQLQQQVQPGPFQSRHQGAAQKASAIQPPLQGQAAQQLDPANR